MEKSVEGGSAEEACRAATIGESLNQDGSEIEAWRSDKDKGGSCTCQELQRQCSGGSRPFSSPQQTGAPPRIFTTQPSGSNRF
jgi:hypothetical protein